MKFRKKVSKLLGEILVEKGVITKAQLSEALEVQMSEGGMIGEIIVKLGFATEEQIAQCLTYQYGFAYLPLENYEISREIINLIPKNVAFHYCVIPLDKIGNTVTVAMANPLNTEAITEVEKTTGNKVQIFVSTMTDINGVINKYYKKG